MPPELASYIAQYGYLAIFLLVFVQEIGVPNPVPNEVVLLFAGYLASIGVLYFPFVLLSVVLADFLGTSLLFFIFYFLGETFFEKKPKWIFISKEMLYRVSQLMSGRDKWGIFVGRLIPYLRGYVSITSGFFRVSPKVFMPIVFFSAVLWSGGYATAGNMLGPYWEVVAEKLKMANKTILIIFAIALLYFFWRHITKHISQKIYKKES